MLFITIEQACELYNSASFNDISRAYLMKALKEAEVDKPTANKILAAFVMLHDEMTAEEILEEFM